MGKSKCKIEKQNLLVGYVYKSFFSADGTTGVPDRAVRSERSVAPRAGTVTGSAEASAAAAVARRRSVFREAAARPRRPGTESWKGNETGTTASNATGRGTESWSGNGIGRPNGRGNARGRERS